MSLDPFEQRRRLLEDVLAHGLLAGGDEPRAAALTRRVTAAAIAGPLDLLQDTIVQQAHLNETTLIVAGAGTLYRFTTEDHGDDTVDERVGATTVTPLAAAFAAWYPFPDGHESGAGILEIGEERFLAAHGEAEGAAAIAAAVQAARGL